MAWRSSSVSRLAGSTMTLGGLGISRMPRRAKSASTEWTSLIIKAPPDPALHLKATGRNPTTRKPLGEKRFESSFPAAIGAQGRQELGYMHSWGHRDFVDSDFLPRIPECKGRFSFRCP